VHDVHDPPNTEISDTKSKQKLHVPALNVWKPAVHVAAVHALVVVSVQLVQEPVTTELTVANVLQATQVLPDKYPPGHCWAWAPPPLLETRQSISTASTAGRDDMPSASGHRATSLCPALLEEACRRPAGSAATARAGGEGAQLISVSAPGSASRASSPAPRYYI
jgi:hypothetical protein